MRFTIFSACFILSISLASVTAAPASAPVEIGMQRRAPAPSGAIWKGSAHEEVQREVQSIESSVNVERRSPEGEIWKNRAHEVVQEKSRSAEPRSESSTSKRLSSIVSSDELQV